MTYSSQTGFVPKYDQNLINWVIRRGFGLLGASGEDAENCLQVCRTGLFGTFPLFRDSLNRWGLERERGGDRKWSFTDLAVASWRFQQNINIFVNNPKSSGILKARLVLTDVNSTSGSS